MPSPSGSSNVPAVRYAFCVLFCWERSATSFAGCDASATIMDKLAEHDEPDAMPKVLGH